MKLSPWIWLVYCALFALSIPWYLPPGGEPVLWLGVPHWVVISLLATLAIAGFTALVVWRYWPEEEGAESGERNTHEDAR